MVDAQREARPLVLKESEACKDSRAGAFLCPFTENTDYVVNRMYGLIQFIILHLCKHRALPC